MAFQDKDGLRDSEEVFFDLVKALSEVDNETQRDALAMQLFGKSANELAGIIDDGGENLRAYGEEAEKLGLVMGEDQINGLLGASDALERAKSTLEAIKNAVAAYFAPALEEALTKATEFGLALFEAIKTGDPEEIKKVLTDIGTYIMDGIGATLPDALDAGCKIVEEILSGIIEAAPDIIDGAIEIMGTLCDSLYELLCDIGDVAPDIIKTLADAITDALPDLIPAALDAVTSFAEGILDNVDELLDTAIDMIEALADGIMKAVPELIKKAPVLVEKFATGIASASQKLLTSAIELVKKLGGFIIDNLPAIIDAGKKIVNTLVNSMINMAGFMGEMVGKLVAKIKNVFETADWKTIGKNIVNGI